MKTVLLLPARTPSYVRPPLTWITRRARRIQRVYGVARRMAIYDAWVDYVNFTCTPAPRAPQLTLVKGGRNG